MTALRVLLQAACVAVCLAPASAAAEPQTFSDCEDCPTMIVVPPGEAVLGAEPHEANRKRGDLALRTVRIAYGLALSRTEVTRAQYRAFVDATGYSPPHDGCNTWGRQRILGYVTHHRWDAPGYPQNEQHPVVCVSHADASAYTEWLNAVSGRAYRLPSSTEFEYATRAGSRGPWFWGTDNADACRYANVADASMRQPFSYAPVFNCDDGYERTAPVATFEPNPWGLYDLLGNVWEWTDDCLHRDPANVPLDGRAWLDADAGECERRTPRGGSWVSGTDWVRAAAQAADRAVYRSQILGFRVALTVEP
ncbi:MAG: SUMF1/EgtB/PvdO family nonheme iron enzyme [Pseudomonadota bacterium]